MRVQVYAIILLLLAPFFSGCTERETLLRTPSGDMVFTISVEKGQPGQPMSHYITVLQADNTTLGKTLLTTHLKDVSHQFDVMEVGNQVLVTAGTGHRKTLWLVWSRGQQRFENPQDFIRLGALARSNGLTYRDPNVFLN